jgi:hypothetical protein
MTGKNKKNIEMFTKKKDPPDFSTFRGIAETYYDYGLITPKIVDGIRNIKKKFTTLKNKQKNGNGSTAFKTKKNNKRIG